MVDDAIVVVENVARHMRTGMPRIQAALISSRQLLVPIIAMTLTLSNGVCTNWFLNWFDWRSI